MAKPTSRILQSLSPPSSEPGAVLLETSRLIVRRWLLSDAPALAAAANHASVTFNLRDRIPSPYTLSDAESFIKNHGLPVENSYPSTVAILLKPDTPTAASSSAEPPVFIGGAGLEPMGDVYYRTWELGYWLAPAAWGKGYATEFVGAFVPWAFATWPRLNRIEASLYARNDKSAGVLRKCGFVEEGRKRGAVEKHGEVLDELTFGILRQDLEKEAL